MCPTPTGQVEQSTRGDSRNGLSRVLSTRATRLYGSHSSRIYWRKGVLVLSRSYNGTARSQHTHPGQVGLYGLWPIAHGPPMVQISDCAFRYCHKLKHIKLDQATSLESIGVEAFESCWAMTSITFPDNANLNIQAGAFRYCKLTRIGWSNGIVEIGNGAFMACNQLMHLDLTAATRLKRIG